MTHNEILGRFFERSYEEEIHQHLLGEENYEIPIASIQSFMTELTQISLTEFFNYLDNHPSLVKIDTGNITSCGPLVACTDEICEVLREGMKTGKSVLQIGQAEIFQKYLRTHNKASWSRYGHRQAKAAGQLGLAFKTGNHWFLSCYGYAFPEMSRAQQAKFLSRALLRSPFYASIVTAVRLNEVHLSASMHGLSASTQGARSGSIVRLLQVVLDEMDREPIKWHDIYVPRYNTKRKVATEHVLQGSASAQDAFGWSDDYFPGGVPLYTVKAACGYFVEHEVPEQEGWMDLSESGVRTNSDDFFVVRAKGDSMLPKIKDGDLCLFKWYRGEALCDDIVLTQCRDYDEEYESSYTIKRFHPNEMDEEGMRTVSLQPLNHEKYRPILLSEEDHCEYKTIGLFVKVLES